MLSLDVSVCVLLLDSLWVVPLVLPTELFSDSVLFVESLVASASVIDWLVPACMPALAPTFRPTVAPDIWESDSVKV